MSNTLKHLALAAVVVVCAAMPAAAKPLYITVNRAFSPSEQPLVDVAFAEKGPVELRVLQPKDLGKYLEKQENLRRAWEKPPSLDNPGRALSHGFNQMKTPGRFLLFSLSTEMRAALGDTLAKRPEAATEAHAALAEGPRKLVGVPDDMTVVAQQWLNLDLGGGDRVFDVPGFSGWSSTSSGFQERRVRLKKLPAGIYVLQLVQGNVEGQVVLVVTDLTVQVKQTDHRILARVASSQQLPVEGATVTVRRVGGKPLTATTNDKGEAFIDVDEPQLLVTAQRPTSAGGTDTAIVDTEFLSTLAASADVFLYSDRPVYRSGDDVQFRGIARQPDGFLSRLFAPKNRSITVSLQAVSGEAKVAATTTLTIDALGSFSGTLHCPDDATEGVYRVQAVLDGAPHIGEVRVQEYVKPTFFVEVTPVTESVQPGSSLSVKVKAERYAGGPPRKTAYEVTLTRTSVDAPSWVDDAGMGGQGSQVTYGSASTTEGKLSVPERLYSSLADRLNDGSADYNDTWASAPLLDDDGTVTVTVNVPALKPGEERIPWKYTLSVRARDDEGTFAGGSSPLFLSPVDVMGVVRFSEAVVRSGKPATLNVRSTTLGGKVAAKTSGAVVFVARNARGEEREVSNKPFVTDDDGVARIEAPTSQIGSMLARVSLFDAKKAAWTGEERLVVVGEGGEPVEWVPELVLTTLGGDVAAGDTAQVVAMLPDEWGPGGKAEGPLWVTLGGTTIFDTRLLSAKGNTVVVPVEIEERFGTAVYVSIGYPTRSGRWEERTVPLRIVPRERLLTISLVPTMAEAEPLGEQTVRVRVTDHEGRGVAASVSLGVVDKAVYAVQAEFRPKAIDFFYPLVRHNVSTFLSAEFQGYGYGHQLARRLGDTGVRFAAVKPPKKKPDERDTAYWNGSILTDDSGSAVVTFRLPSNQTLWTMTAVAADSDGRVGEGLGQFATRGRSTLHVSAPQFLRAGDTATAMARFARGKDSDFKGTLAVTASSTGALQAKAGAASVDLSAASEGVVPVALSASSTGVGALSLRVGGGASGLLDSRSIDVEPATVVDTVSVSKVGGGALALPAAKDATFSDVELVLQGSLLEASLSDLRELLVYPYGCLEQLVATTAPSLALINALEELRSVGKLNEEQQALLVEARSRATSGVQRILANASAAGGFSWYGAETPSVEMTVLALGGLVPAIRAGVLAPREPRVVASVNWLQAQTGLSPHLDAWRSWVLAHHDPKGSAARVRATLEASTTTTLDPVAGALLVLAAQTAGLDKEAGTSTTVKALASSSRAAFVGGKPSTSADDSWRLPVFAAGQQAILGHAAHLDGGDVKALKARYLQLFADDTLSTLDRATLIQHSLWLVVDDAKQVAATKAPKVNGAGAAFVRRGFGLVARLPANTTTATVDAFDGVATLRATRSLPASSAPALNAGFGIERRYWSIGSGTKREITAGSSVAQGDLVWVQLSLQLNGDARNRSAYTVVEDFVPAGFSPLREDKEFRGAPLELPLVPEQLRQRTFSPRKVAFFLEEQAWWMGSPREVGYVMRADFAGTFIAPPARVEDMYRSTAVGRTTATTLTVTPSSNGR